MAAGPPKAKPKQAPSKAAIVIGVLVAFVLGALFAWLLSQWINVSPDSVDTSSTGTGVSEGGRGKGNGQQEKPGPGGQTGQTGSGSGGDGRSKEDRVLISEMLLPKTLEPVRYNLELKTYLPGYATPISKEKNLTFDGKVAIEFLVHESVNKIELNSLGLEINAGNCSLVTSDQKMIKVDKVEIQEKLEKAVFHFKEKLPKGKLIFTIVYSGKMSHSVLSGLYQTRYRQSDGLEKIAVVTQMEPMDARRMVPCYDEPEHKAIWKVSMIHPKGTRAISNGIEEGPTKETNDGFLQTTFIETPRMSSYLLAVMVSEFQYIEGHTKNGVRYRIWARPEAIKTAEYALTAGVKCLERLEDYFGVPFPLKKQDMVAVPDFAMGAMENWGLITYRETALLYDPQNYNYDNKQRVATVIAHELAHQWFGNLVTMKWWDDIWLNEGFASYVENIGVDMINDGAFEMEKQFISGQIARTLAADSTASSHPIIFDIEYKEEVNDLFDAISYQKGGSVLSMINHVMGDAFEKGVTNYLKRYGYKNTVHSDLFKEWDDVVPEDMLGPDGNRFNVTAFALRWTKQMGYPLLTMKTTTGNARIEQERFKLDPAAKEREKFANPAYGFKWDVPVWIQQGNQPAQLYWLTPEGFINLRLEPGVPVVINADSNAIARTNYDEKGWDMIIDQLKKDNTIYSEKTKYRLVSDVFTMAEVEKISLEKALSLASYIVNEKTYLPWSALFSTLNTLSDYYGSMPEGREVDKYKKRLLEPIYQKIDISKVIEEIKDDASFTAKKLEVSQWLHYCSVDRSACKKNFKEIFDESFVANCQNQKMASECTAVPNAIREAVYCSAVRDGGDDVFDMMLEKYEKETLQLEHKKLMSAITCTRNPVLLKWILAQLLKTEKSIFRRQDCGFVSSYVADNPVGAEIVVNFLMSNWQKIVKTYAEDQSIISNMITAFTSPIRSRHGLRQLEKFVEDEKETTAKYYTFTKMIQTIERKVDWLEKQGQKVAELLAKA